MNFPLMTFTMSCLTLFVTPPINVCHNVHVLPSGLGFQAKFCPYYSDEMMHGYARFSRDVSAERDLSKQIRLSVAVDRSAWLDLLLSGDWNEIRQLRKGFAPKCGRLRDDDGKVVESGLHAESEPTTCQQNSEKQFVAKLLPHVGGPLHFATQSVSM